MVFNLIFSCQSYNGIVNKIGQSKPVIIFSYKNVATVLALSVLVATALAQLVT